MMKQDARKKLAKSVRAARYGDLHKQTRIVHEDVAADVVYHVTHTKHVAKIQKHGIMPMKTSNWVKAGDKERYGGGEVYAFTHKDDAHQWAGRMDWAHHQKLGSGNISIICPLQIEGKTYFQRLQ
jgi:P2-related tail formation protein